MMGGVGHLQVQTGEGLLILGWFLNAINEPYCKVLQCGCGLCAVLCCVQAVGAVERHPARVQAVWAVHRRHTAQQATGGGNRCILATCTSVCTHCCTVLQLAWPNPV